MDESKKGETPVNESVDKPETGPLQSGGDFQAAAFQEVEAERAAGHSGVQPNLDMILDVPVTLSLEVGRTEMSVGNLLRLTQGAVVELDRSAGEPLDVMVNGALVAHGEIVVINDKFGIRLVDVVHRADKVPATAGE